MVGQKPLLGPLVECLEKLIGRNGRVKLMGVLILVLREASVSGSSGPGGEWGTSEAGRPARGAKGRARRWPATLKGILFPGLGKKELVHHGRPMSDWTNDLKDKSLRGRAIHSLLQAVEGRELLAQEGIKIKAAASIKEARVLLSGPLPDLMLLDLGLPGDSGLELLQELGARSGIEVVVVSGEEGAPSTAPSAAPSVAATPGTAGVSGNGHHSHPQEAHREAGSSAAAPARSDEEAAPARRASRYGRNRFGPMVGASQAMQEVYDLIMRVAPTEATVLVTGESGTGKELVAQALHSVSKRSRKPYYAVNCGAISPNLIDSELFGHEQGSFTGASHMHRGHFERANGGTLFLDEITEMPMELQVKLLRVLENGNFMRVGGDQQVEVDVRVIAATNRRLEDAVAEGKLREDLLYRLNVFPIHLPQLRERHDDVDLLAGHFLAELNKAESIQKKFTRAAMERLRAYGWPGNVRELKNVIQRAFILADDRITAECLPREVGGKEAPSECSLQLKVGTPLAEAERRLILATFDQCDGNKMKTAEVLGISLRTLYNRLDSYWQGDEAR